MKPMLSNSPAIYSSETVPGLTARVAATGSSATFDRIYAEHRDRVYHLCLRYGAGNPAWAEDATHDVFIKLIDHLPRLARPDDLGGWVYRVTANTCLTRLKREGRVWGKVRKAIASEAAAEPETPERRLQLRRGLQAVLDQLGKMPAKERVVFCMRYLDELSQQEIARSLSLSKGYVSKLLTRARARLERAGWEVPIG